MHQFFSYTRSARATNTHIVHTLIPCKARDITDCAAVAYQAHVWRGAPAVLKLVLVSAALAAASALSS
jgi:hypothetical protein